MKIIYILLSWILLLNSATAGLPPTVLSGQNQTVKPTTFSFKTPNSTATQTSGTESLIETGNKNILVNPDFEHSTFNNSWTNAIVTPSVEATTVISGKKSVIMSPSAQTFTFVQDSTLYASNFQGSTQLLAMVWIRTNQSGITVCSRNDGVTSTTNCVTVAPQSPSVWQLIKVPFISSSTSNGISIAASSSITGNVYIDDAFVGAVDLKTDVDQSRIAGSSYWQGTTSCQTDRTSTTTGAFTATAACPAPTVEFSTMGTWLTTDANLFRQSIDNLPAGTYKATFIVTNNQSVSATASLAIFDGTTICEPNEGNDSSTFANGNIVSCVFRYSSSGNRAFEIYGASSSGTMSILGNRTAPRISNKFILEYFGSGQIYSASCGANCVDTFSAKVSVTSVVSEENADFINGNCSYVAPALTCNFNSGTFTTAPNCQFTGSTGPESRITAQSTSSITIQLFTSGANAANGSGNISCQKTGADFVASRTIVGSFEGMMNVPNVSKPKTCYYAFGGASATLAAPTECTTGTCVEVYDSCGTGTPPTWASAAIYNALTFASGTFANSTPVKCDCTAYDILTSNPRNCSPYFITGQNTWSSNSSGGFVNNFYATTSAGGENASYVQVKCEGSAP